MAKQSPRQHPRMTLWAFAVLAVPGLCAAAAGQMNPGQWEVTVRMEMPGMPPQAQQTHTVSQCITPELARNPRATVENFNTHAEGEVKCTMSNFNVSGDTTTWSVDCTGDHPAHMDGEMILEGNAAYHGSTKMTLPGPHGKMIMTQAISGRRIGECAQ